MRANHRRHRVLGCRPADRIWAKHQTISDPEHVEAAKLLRRKRFDIIGPPTHVEVEQRCLADYDTLLGLNGPVA